MLEKSITTLSQYSLFDNNLGNVLKAIIVFLILIGLFKLFQKIILKRLKQLAKKTKSDVDDTLIEIFQSIKPPFYSFLAFYLAFQLLFFGDFTAKIISTALIILVFYQIIIAVQIFIDYLIKKFSKNEKTPGTKVAYKMVGKVLKVILWVFGILLILSNLGVKVTSVVAGLGIGGVAIAFALQNILSDIFASFSIYFDKPFQAGDFIIIGEDLGTVKKIGIKSTRIQTLQGEELVVSNKELTESRIHNYKRMERRRIAFNFGVTYETLTGKVKKIPGMIKEIIGKIELADLDRVHFKKFGDFSLNFEVIYYLNSSDYTKYMDIQQEINLAVKERFEEEGIEFAYPTQSIYLKK